MSKITEVMILGSSKSGIPIIARNETEKKEAENIAKRLGVDVEIWLLKSLKEKYRNG